MRNWFMTCALAAPVGLLVGLMATANPQPAMAGFADELEASLRKLDRRICREVQGKACAPSRKAVRQRTPAAKPVQKQKKPVQQKAAKAAPTALPSELRETPPLPRAKPAGLSPPEQQVAVIPAMIPMPRQKPAQSPAPPPEPGIPPHETANDTGCGAALAELGVVFRHAATPVSAGACNVSEPVRLLRISTRHGEVELQDTPLLNCDFARRFAGWVSAEAQDIAMQTVGRPLAQLSTGPGYQCRARNGDGSGKISEHGFGNAVDVTTLTLAGGKVVKVEDALDPRSPDHRLLAALRKSGCGRFSTVLGPGSNDAHAEHFHFDNGRHGKTGTYRICE